MAKVTFIEQSEHSECGIAAVTMLLNYYGVTVKLNDVRDYYGVPKGGNTLFHLKEISSDFGFETIGVKVKDPVGFFRENNAPCLLFWEHRHYVVFEKILGNKVTIVDPALGRKSYSIQAFCEHFSDVALLVNAIDETKEIPVPSEKSPDTLWTTLSKEKFLIMGLVLLTVVIQFLGVGIPVITQRVVDNYLAIAVDFTHQSMIISVFIVFLCYYLLQAMRNIVITKFQLHFEEKLMVIFMKKMLSMPLNFFVNRSTGDLIFRGNLTTYIQQILSTQLLTTVIDLVLVVAYFSLMISYSIELTVISMTGIMIIVVSTFIYSRAYRSSTDLDIQLNGQVHQTLVELFEGIETIKSIGAEETFYQDWENAFMRQQALRKKKSRVSGWIGTIPSSMQFVLPLLITGVGLFGVSEGTFTMGELISFNAISLSFVVPIVTVMNSATQFLILRSYFGKLAEILSQKNRREEASAQQVANYESIELKQVDFYFSKFEEPVLKNIDLKIDKTEKIAIVGPSGSGKTTLLKVISGLYLPTAGKVLLNGKDMTTIQQASLRQLISVVNQNPTIFQRSLKANVLINTPDSAQELLLQAITDARVDEMTRLLPMGLDTLVSEGGMNLSGGQMQRIAIARALVKQPQLLLMDEPTSALDNISENFIMKRIKTYDFPCVIVSHRLNTIQHFDRILVMDQGEIVEDGTHEELMAKKGLYSYIYSGNTDLVEWTASSL